jgi:hypothetical protein
MSPDILLISTSVTLLVLALILVSMFMTLNRSLATLAELLRGMQREVSPMIGDIRTISLNVAAASGSLRTGMEQVQRMTGALGNIGDDLEAGRKAVKGGVEMFTAPWPLKIWLIGQKLFNGFSAKNGAPEA